MAARVDEAAFAPEGPSPVRMWGVPFSQLALPADRSPIAASADLRVGGNTLFILGSPGMGKSVLAYMFARSRSDRMRLWVRGTMDYTWHEAYGREATVWVPRGEVPTLSAYAGADRVDPRDPPAIREYDSLRDLISKAETGGANVLYWPEGPEGLDQWLRFCWYLRHREDAEPQLLLDDEVHEIAPARGSSPDPEEYRRMGIARRVLADSRKSDMSWILSSHQSHDIDYSILGKGHYYALLTGARVPRHLPVQRFDPSEAIGRATRGEGVFGGPGPSGFQWEIFHFSPPPGARPYRLRVAFPGEAEYPEFHRHYGASRGIGGEGAPGKVSGGPRVRAQGAMEPQVLGGESSDLDPWLRTKEVCQLLHVSPRWVRRELAAGRLRGMVIRPGLGMPTYRFRLRDVLAIATPTGPRASPTLDEGEKEER
jgi:hypothetical protein